MGFHNLFQENRIPKSVRRSDSSIGISYENQFVCGSTYSSSPLTSTGLKEWKRMIKEMEKTKHVRSSSDGAILGVETGRCLRKRLITTPLPVIKVFMTKNRQLPGQDCYLVCDSFKSFT
ncbi:hypothetical protein PVK06_027939 [Gossypium arboreum]|uniref:Uncharacterized protein n=1 Tax=Gossypium arboreum TaxID=29729 RepID=A0ABR0P1Q3_GOSAR|nr:hypothetical protein PVK06_027939 [Gossypium arboreum]